MAGSHARSAIVAVVCAAGCNAFSGVSDLSFAPDPGSASSAGAQSSSVTGAGPGGGPAATGGGSGGGGAAGTTASGAGGGGGAGQGGARGGGTPPLPCHGAECQVGSICCHDTTNPHPNNDVCALPGSCPAGFGEVTCSGPAHCPGQVCCQLWSSAGQTTLATACQDQCQLANDEYVMCWGDPSACPMGQPCKPSPSLGEGFAWCDPT